MDACKRKRHCCSCCASVFWLVGCAHCAAAWLLGLLRLSALIGVICGFCLTGAKSRSRSIYVCTKSSQQ